MKTLGVLGGMGPAATVAFLARLQALTPATGDADHIRVLMDLNPHVPDRNTRPGEAEVELGAMARRLAGLLFDGVSARPEDGNRNRGGSEP